MILLKKGADLWRKVNLNIVLFYQLTKLDYSENVVKNILEKLKHSDKAEKLERAKFEESFAAFIDNYEAWARKNGRLKADRRKLTEYRLTGAEIARKIWDVNNFKETSTDEEEKSEIVSRKDVNKSKKTATDEEGKSEIVTRTPTNQKLISTKVKFAQLSPKLDLLQTFQCHLCQKRYDWLKSLVRHLKNAHAGAEVEGNPAEVQDYVTCRMCKKRQRRENIRRHLFDIHGVVKQGPAAIFRGFVTVDEESWQPLFLEKGEEDPSAETTHMVPVRDGIVNVFGVEFNVRETISPASQESRYSSSSFEFEDTPLFATKLDENENTKNETFDNSSSRQEDMEQDTEEKTMNKESFIDDFSKRRVKRKLWDWVDDEFDDTEVDNNSQELDPKKSENNPETGKEISGGDDIVYQPLPLLKVQTFSGR